MLTFRRSRDRSVIRLALFVSSAFAAAYVCRFTVGPISLTYIKNKLASFSSSPRFGDSPVNAHISLKPHNNYNNEGLSKIPAWRRCVNELEAHPFVLANSLNTPFLCLNPRDPDIFNFVMDEVDRGDLTNLPSIPSNQVFLNPAVFHVSRYMQPTVDYLRSMMRDQNRTVHLIGDLEGEVFFDFIPTEEGEVSEVVGEVKKDEAGEEDGESEEEAGEGGESEKERETGEGGELQKGKHRDDRRLSEVSGVTRMEDVGGMNYTWVVVDEVGEWGELSELSAIMYGENEMIGVDDQLRKVNVTLRDGSSNSERRLDTEGKIDEGAKKEDKKKAFSMKSAQRKDSLGFVIVRMLNNDLYPLHSPDRSRRNSQYVLNHENTPRIFKSVALRTGWFVPGRLPDRRRLGEVEHWDEIDGEGGGELVEEKTLDRDETPGTPSRILGGDQTSNRRPVPTHLLETHKVVEQPEDDEAADLPKHMKMRLLGVNTFWVNNRIFNLTESNLLTHQLRIHGQDILYLPLSLPLLQLAVDPVSYVLNRHGGQAQAFLESAGIGARWTMMIDSHTFITDQGYKTMTRLVVAAEKIFTRVVVIPQVRLKVEQDPLWLNKDTRVEDLIDKQRYISSNWAAPVLIILSSFASAYKPKGVAYREVTQEILLEYMLRRHYARDQPERISCIEVIQAYLTGSPKPTSQKGLSLLKRCGVAYRLYDYPPSDSHLKDFMAGVIEA
eukprot:GHVN01030725.1.p1 GENE.GHVN01030725.1~~GHVN01030725.1.p1  ORF type:complete len:722 (-),score=141.79 GHVN01030725.1:537-2702(-)